MSCPKEYGDPYWRIAAIAILLALFVVIILGYVLNWHWTGLVPETSEPKQHMKTLWDWLQLLVIPLMLAIGGFWLNQLQKSRDDRATEQRAEQEQKAAEQRAQLERELARNNQEEALLQAYIDKISELLLREHLDERTADGQLKPEYEQVRNVARVGVPTFLPPIFPAKDSPG